MAIAIAVATAGCILPVSTGAPLPATTVGKGNIGFALSGEAPTLDLIADQDNKQAGNSDAIAYGAAPAAASSLTFSYGLTENTDLEIAGEGALYYFFFPAPTGGSIGLRQHIDAGESFDLGIAARFGHVGSTVTVTDSNGDKTESGARANYAAVQAIAQTKHGVVRPLVAVNLMPAHVKRSPSDGEDFSFNGLASSVTMCLQFVGRNAVVGPYVTGTNFYSDKFDNSGWFVSGGLMIALRPDRNRPRLPMPDTTPPMYTPGPGGPPMGGAPPAPPSGPGVPTTPGVPGTPPPPPDGTMQQPPSPPPPQPTTQPM